MARLVSLISVLLMTAVVGSASSPQPLKVVPSVDFLRYAGRWYEVARLPNRFQNQCVGEVVASYSLLETDRLKVVNECRQSNGQMSRAEGIARLADKRGPKSKLKVRFAPAWLSWLPAVWGDYWVIDLAADYSFSVVGTPDRKYLWILSRSSKMDEGIYQKIVRQVEAEGFDVSRLAKTPQRPVTAELEPDRAETL